MKENHLMCIYRIVFPNGKSYVGQAKDFKVRQWQRNVDYKKWLKLKDDENATDLERRGSNPKLFRAFLKHGVENCTIEILEENIENSDLLNEREIYWIAFYDCIENGYNILEGGSGVGLNPETGRGFNYGCSTEYDVCYSDDVNAWKKEFYQKHREEIRKKQYEDYKNGGYLKRKERYEENKENEKQRSKNYYDTHKERVSEIKRRYRESHAEEISQYSKEYYEKNKEKILQANKERRENNKEEYLEYRKEWRLKNSDKLREQRKERRDELNAKNREYKANNQDKVKERWKIDSENRKKLSEADKENFVTCAIAGCFRRFFWWWKDESSFFHGAKRVYK